MITLTSNERTGKPFLLHPVMPGLWDGAFQIPYLPNSSADLKPNDITLRSAVAPDASEPVAAVVSSSASTKAPLIDLNKDIEDLLNMDVLTDLEDKDKRAEIIAEL